MEKTKLMAKAIDAFKAQYGGLPADVGYPVVRECGENVYFGRSLHDWNAYQTESRWLAAFMIISVLFIAGGCVSLVCWLSFSLSPWYLLGLSTLNLVTLCASIACYLKLVKLGRVKYDTDAMLVYEDFYGKISAVSLK